MTVRSAPLPLLLGLSLAVGLTACGGRETVLVPAPERSPVTLSPMDVQYIAILLRHEDVRDYQPAVFTRLAEGGSEEVRRRVVLAAGRIGDSTALPLLVRLLDGDPSTAVRADAAFALGELGDTSAVVLESLRNAVAGDWTPVRPEQTTLVVEVLGALGKLGTEGAHDMVVTALREAHPAADPHSRRVAAEALLAAWKFDRGHATLRSAARYLESPDPELRWRAAYALMRDGRPDGAARLLNAIADDDHRVRALAARALTGPRADSAGVGDRARAALVAMLPDRHPHVRINAARSLGSYGPDAPVEAMAPLLRDDRADVAIAAASALGAAGERALPELAGLAADAAEPLPVRSAAVLQLAGLDGDAAARTAEGWAAGTVAERYEAARLLGALGWDRGRDLFGRLARDEDTRVAVAALAAAEGLAGDSTLDAAAGQGLRTLLLDMARAPDPRRRAVALRGLGPLLTADDIETVMGAFGRAVEDSAARPAAIAAVEALAALERRGTDGVGTAFADRFPPPRDRWIARAVSTWLEDRGLEDEADTSEEGAAADSAADEAPVDEAAVDEAAAREGVDSARPGTVPATSDDPEFYRQIVRDYIAGPLATGVRPEAVIETEHGRIVLTLLAEEAPLTVHNFITLAEAGYFDDGVWHRVIPNFVLQDGAPAGDPGGGPGWSIRDEINRARYDRGTLGMALSGPDTGGSQWFITHSPQPHLDGGYTVFGRVRSGMDAADDVLQGEPVRSIRIEWQR